MAQNLLGPVCPVPLTVRGITGLKAAPVVVLVQGHVPYVFERAQPRRSWPPSRRAVLARRAPAVYWSGGATRCGGNIQRAAEAAALASLLNPAKPLPNLRRGLRRAASRRAVAHVDASLDRYVTSPRGASATIFRERGHLFYEQLVILGARRAAGATSPTPLCFPKEECHPPFLR